MAVCLIKKKVYHAHMFCGLGSGAAGFNDGEARVGMMEADFECVGGIDVDRAGIADFERMTGAKGTVRDLFSLEQYLAFHGKPPPPGWTEAQPADIRRAFTHRPHVLFLSAPCKGFSGLLSETNSKTDKYQALNALTLRGMWLFLEAYADDPVELIVFENVPRIASRGRFLLDQIISMLRHFGYAVRESTHDCGELGELAQSRKRFLLVARHAEKVPPFLYEPPKHRLRGVGEVLDYMPLPGDPRGGPMHRVPMLQWQTWVRLAFVEAGSDWRSLNKLKVADGVLADFGIVPEPLRNGGLGVLSYDAPAGTVQGESFPTNGRFAVADPRGGPDPDALHGKHRVETWGEPSRAVIAGRENGATAVADPRPTHGPNAHQNKMKVVDYRERAPTVTGSDRVGSGALSVADPRPHGLNANGRGINPDVGVMYVDHYGVLGWNETSKAVSGAAGIDNGRWSVADPRGPAVPPAPVLALPSAKDRLVCVIRSLDGTWHRPFTTLELAALQSFFDPEEVFAFLHDPSAPPFTFELEGKSDSAWRERIGNAVPRAAGKAIASTMGRTLLLAWSGETFMLSTEAIWVQPLEVALALEGQSPAFDEILAMEDAA